MSCFMRWAMYGATTSTILCLADERWQARVVVAVAVEGSGGRAGSTHDRAAREALEHGPGLARCWRMCACAEGPAPRVMRHEPRVTRQACQATPRLASRATSGASQRTGRESLQADGFPGLHGHFKFHVSPPARHSSACQPHDSCRPQGVHAPHSGRTSVGKAASST